MKLNTIANFTVPGLYFHPLCKSDSWKFKHDLAFFGEVDEYDVTPAGISEARCPPGSQPTVRGSRVKGGLLRVGVEKGWEGVRDAATLKLSADAGASLVNCCGGTWQGWRRVEGGDGGSGWRMEGGWRWVEGGMEDAGRFASACRRDALHPKLAASLFTPTPTPVPYFPLDFAFLLHRWILKMFFFSSGFKTFLATNRHYYFFKY